MLVIHSDLDEMVKQFESNIKEALDEVAPMKTCRIKSSYKFGLSEKTKELMRARDLTRNKIKTCNGTEKETLNKKYITLRNKVTSQIRKDNLHFNNNKINEAKSEGELWRIANNVIKPTNQMNL